jgi:excisionase family DNA binding protein
MEEQLFIPEVEPVLYNKQEAATYLHTSERHIERLVEQGVLGHCRVGRFVMFREEDLNGYLARTHVEPKEVN